jgi:ketosteroid isomerase-like protein
MRSLLLTCSVFVALSTSLFAQANAPATSELTKLLNDFLAGASRNDVAMHDRFWADDLIYTGSSGWRIGKADIMREVRADEKEPKKDEPPTIFTAEDVRVQQYGDTAIVAFRLVGTTEKDGGKEVKNYLNTGTFLKRNGEWRAVAWQATVMPKEGETKPQ